MLNLHHISAAYNGKRVLNDITLAAHTGEIVGLVGPNGAGKSTLLRVISGTLAPKTGRVVLGDVELTNLNPAQRARRIAVVPQSSQLPEAFTVSEIVMMGRAPHQSFFGGDSARDFEIARDAMERADVLDLAERLVGKLSGGERQRVLIARALAQITDVNPDGPRALLLDEATAHLDLKHQADLWALVRELARSGRVVIAALHDLNLAGQFADRLALLAQGDLLVYDRPERVLTPAWLERAYKVSAVISQHPLYHTPMVALVESNGNHESIGRSG